MKKPILIVEDDAEVRESLADALRDHGYEVHSATNGREGLEVLTTIAALPGLVLLDLMMPVMDGFGFRDLQLKDPRIASIPTAVLSADGHVQLKAERAKVDEYVRKPVELATLVKLARKYCG
jgi:two-component system chemotaxis response regulator CheY